MKRKRGTRGVVWLAVMDAGVFVLSLLVASCVVFRVPFGEFVPRNFYFMALLAATVALNFYFFDLYFTLKDFRRFRQAVNLFLAVLLSFIISAAVIFIGRSMPWGSAYLAVFFTVIFIGASFNRVIFSMANRNVVLKRAAVIGVNGQAMDLTGKINHLRSVGRNTGIEIVGYVSAPETPAEGITAMRHLGKVEDLGRILAEHDISLMIYARKASAAVGLNEDVVAAKLRGVDLISVGALSSAITGQIPYEDLDEGWLIEECLRGNKFSEIRIKRTLDIAIGTFFAVLFLPLVGLLALVIKIATREPAFFCQERIGRFGRPFVMIKLRTMSSECPPEQDPEGWHKRNEARVTRIGGFLRKAHLDEIPQFLNVIKGDMSIVGPRPEMEIFIKQCEETIPFYRLRLAVRPGITGWAQVWYPHTSTLEAYKEKFKYDLFYLANLSVKLDLEIMVRTLLWVMGYSRPGLEELSQKGVK